MILSSYICLLSTALSPSFLLCHSHSLPFSPPSSFSLTYSLPLYSSPVSPSPPFSFPPPPLPPTQQPFFSYSAQDPLKYFALSCKEGEWGDQGPPLYIPHTGTVQWVGSANAVCRPQLLDVLNSSVGPEQLIYLYAKVYIHVHARTLYVWYN